VTTNEGRGDESARPRVVCAGHVNWDVTIGVDALPEPDGEATIARQSGAGGGSAANVAAGLAGLDCAPLLLGSVGDDEYGTLARDELAATGVDCSRVRQVEDGETTVKYLVVDETGAVMVLADDGVNEQFAADDLPRETLADADWLHLTGQPPRVAETLARRASDLRVPVSFDPGRRLADREFGPVFELADVVFLNEREADVGGDRALLADDATQVVRTRGADGATLWDDGQRRTHEGFEVTTFNTAGAGDAFAAGFLAAHLDGAGEERALAVGNACGALAASAPETRVSLSWPALDRYLEGVPSSD